MNNDRELTPNERLAQRRRSSRPHVHVPQPAPERIENPEGADPQEMRGAIKLVYGDPPSYMDALRNEADECITLGLKNLRATGRHFVDCVAAIASTTICVVWSLGLPLWAVFRRRDERTAHRLAKGKLLADMARDGVRASMGGPHVGAVVFASITAMRNQDPETVAQAIRDGIKDGTRDLRGELKKARPPEMLVDAKPSQDAFSWDAPSAVVPPMLRIAEDEKIHCAAILLSELREQVLSEPAPARHSNILTASVSERQAIREQTMGFLTTHGRFVNRHQGARIAKRHKQLLPGHENAKSLTTEDLW